MNVESFIYSPFPAAVLGNLFYPYRLIKMNLMLGNELAPVRLLDGTGYCIIPSFWENMQFVTRKRPFYSLWDGYMPTVLADVTYLFTYSFSSNFLFNRKRHKAEYFKAAESNRLAYEECILSLICNTITIPLRVISWRSMAQLCGPECFDYRVNILGGLRHIAKVEGLSGFYKGVVPLIITDLLKILLTRVLFEATLKFTKKYRDLRNKDSSRRSKRETRSLNQFENLFTIFVSFMFHPLSLVTLLMNMNCSEVTPFVRYRNVMHCLRHLYSTSSLYRGFMNVFPFYIPV